MRSWRKYQDTSYMLKLPLESGHWPSSGLRLCLITFPRPVWISHIPHSLYFPFSSECPQCRSICFVIWRWTFFISLFFFIRFSSPANGYRVPPVSLFCLLTFFQFNFLFFIKFSSPANGCRVPPVSPVSRLLNTSKFLAQPPSSLSWRVFICNLEDLTISYC